MVRASIIRQTNDRIEVRISGPQDRTLYLQFRRNFHFDLTQSDQGNFLAMAGVPSAMIWQDDLHVAGRVEQCGQGTARNIIARSRLWLMKS
jgi:hypothetical protein